MNFRTPIASAVAALSLLLTQAHAAPAFVNGLIVDGTTLDAAGGTLVNDGRVGFFSDIYYDPARKEWWALSDRGPGGGTLDYETRVHRFQIDVHPYEPVGLGNRRLQTDRSGPFFTVFLSHSWAMGLQIRQKLSSLGPVFAFGAPSPTGS